MGTAISASFSQPVLSKAQLWQLRREAQALQPVVMLGYRGLTEAVIAEADAALTAHHLIKVRVQSDDRAERMDVAQALCDELGAQLVQHIGKLLVLWRAPDAATKEA